MADLTFKLVNALLIFTVVMFQAQSIEKL